MNNDNPLYNATLVDRIDITPDLVQFRILPDAGVPNFTPGQYVALGLLPEVDGDAEESPKPKLVKRAYSIGSSPEEREFLEFYVAIVQGGALTSQLMKLEPGGRLFCAAKVTGHFVLNDVPADKNLVLVGTGTGIAPYISMLRTPSTWTDGRQISIIHGVRYNQDLAYREELEGLADRSEEVQTFSYYAAVSREDPPGGHRKGYVQHLFQDQVVELDVERDHVFLCGNPAMITDVVEMLTEQGFKEHSRKSPGNLHFEKYW